MRAAVNGEPMKRDKVTAGILAMLFGLFGIHRFYLGQAGLGILYFIFFPLAIPMFIGFIDGIIILTMDDELFDQKFNRDYQSNYSDNGQQNQRGNHRRHREHRQTQSQNRRNNAQRTNPFKESAIRKYKNYDFEGSIEDFKKSLSVQPDDPVTHFNLACAYSLTEQVEEGFFHLSKAVENGYSDLDKITNDGDLAFLRVQDEWEDFVKNDYRQSALKPKQIEAATNVNLDEIINKIEKLGKLKEKGLLSDVEFQKQKEKLLDQLD